jgi:hypothetical protein
MAKQERTKGQTTIYKTLHRNLKIKQHEPHKLEAQPTEPVSLTWQQNDTEANFKGR